MNGETLSLYPKEDADKIMKQETGYPEDFIEKLQKNQPDFTLYSLSVAEFSEGNDMYSVFSYYAVGNKFLLINPGLDGEFEDHPSEWFTATTTMESPEIVSRSYKAATLFSPSYGDVFAIGEFK